MKSKIEALDRAWKSSDAASLAEMFKSSNENDALKAQIEMILKKSDSKHDFLQEMLKYQTAQVRNAATLAGKLKATDRMDAKSEDEDSGQRKMSEGDEESGT
jgi:hypothetical protein